MKVFETAFIILLWAVPVFGQSIPGSCNDTSKCGPHGRCIEGEDPNTYWCRCDNGYGGEQCDLKCDLKCSDEQKCALDVYGGNEICVCKNCTVRDTQGSDLCPLGFTGANCNVPVKETDPCEWNPCNNGQCYSFNGGFQCICDHGFRGSYCEEGTDHCKENSCTNGSQCINTFEGYFCDCLPGKSGRFCEKTECSLLGNICNHGQCILSTSSDKEFECQCDAGFEGEFCNQDKNECLDNDKELCPNGSICRNTVGSFYCECPPGYTGRLCDEPLELCDNFPCENNGTCLKLPNQLPVCACAQGFIGPRCEQECPPGFGGASCDIPLEEAFCSRTRENCVNNGKCIGGFCVCPPSFTGNRCEIDRTVLSDDFIKCDSKPCLLNSTCVEVEGDIGYACNCLPGTYGSNCENIKALCAENPCANGGLCQQHGYDVTCECPVGYSGKYCQRKDKMFCYPNPCENGGVCRGNRHRGICECPYGFIGVTCETPLNSTEPKETLSRDLCAQRNCSKKASNGVCDPDCNMKECDFDGGDCSGGQQKPFSKCQYASRCAELFADGVCDQECNTEACLYDGLDCQPALDRCPLRIRDHCLKVRGDGNCDKECSSAGCGFDGGDCTNRAEALILHDIRIKVQIDPVEFQATGGRTLMEISARLQATVRIQKDQHGPLVFEWDGEKETSRVEMDASKLAQQLVLSHHVRQRRETPVRGVVVYLEVEEVCRPITRCRFSTAQSVVDLIAAGLASTNGRTSLGLPIVEAMVATPRQNEESKGWSKHQVVLIGVIAFLAFGTVVAGVVVKTGDNDRSRKRKIVQAITWMPPMDPALEKANRDQSINSSQCSLLEATSHYNGAKRHCGDYQTENGGHYDRIYPQPPAQEYMNDFGVVPQQNVIEQPGYVYNLPPEHIALHVEAAGPGAIISPITKETVSQVDSKYRRNVLHWLAGNATGKPESWITSEVILCLNAGADVNTRDCDENTPLMIAVRARRVRLAVILMSRGANPTIFNNYERNALHEAVINRDLRMMTNLLTDRRLLNEIDELDQNGMTALMHAARSCGDIQVDLAKLLLSKGAKIDADGASSKDSEKYHGRTALHYAALGGNEQMAAFLMSRNSNKDKQDEAGRTPLMLAAKEGHEDVVRCLVEHGASVTHVDSMDQTAAQIAQKSYNIEIAEYLTIISLQKHRKDPYGQMQSRNATGSAATRGRQTMKAVKRAGSKKAPALGISSRDSNHLTPPPSEGSFSSPSPHYFHTTSSTPSCHESSPEYVFNAHPNTASSSTFFTPPPYSDSKYNQMPPNLNYMHYNPADNSYYC